MSEPGQPPAAADPAALLERAEELLLGGPRRYTRTEVAARAGVELDEAVALWRSLGFAGVADTEVVFTDEDVQALRSVRELIALGVADPKLLQAITRLLGQSFARLAAGQGQLLAGLLAQQTETQERLLDLLTTLVPVLQQVQDYVWRRQLAAVLARAASGGAASGTPVAGDTMPLTAVGFADLAGFTTLTRRATEAEFAELVEAFESVTTEVVAAQRGRIVKTIGDEVLFVAGSARQGAEIALELVARVHADERLPALRVGLAFGPVVGRLGDVYGSTVNIASRLTSLARPGSVLVDREIAEALRADPAYQLSARRAEQVRGFAHLRSWRLRRAGTGAAQHGSPGSSAPRR